MRLVQQVVLDDTERRLLTEALVHIGIAFPDDRRDAPEVRALRHMASGQPTSVEVAERAHASLRALELRCHAEAHAEFWQANLAVAPARRRRLEQTAVGLIANPEHFCAMMADTRRLQATHARHARRVTLTALRTLPVAVGL